MKNSQKSLINWQRLRVSGAPNSTKHVAWTVHEERAWFAYASYRRVYIGSCSTKYDYQADNLPIRQILNISGAVSSITWSETPIEESSVSRVKWCAPIAPSLVIGLQDNGDVVVFRPINVKYASMPNILTLEKKPSVRVQTSCRNVDVSAMSGGRYFLTTGKNRTLLWYQNNRKRDDYCVVYENNLSKRSVNSTCISQDGRLIAFACDTKIYVLYRMSEDNFPAEQVLRRAHEIRLKFPALNIDEAQRLLRKEFERDTIETWEKELDRIFSGKPRDSRYGEIELEHSNTNVTSISWRPTSTPSTGRNQSNTSDLRTRLLANALLVTTSSGDVYLWQEAFESCSLGAKPRFIPVARLECDSTCSASWIHPIFPRPYASRGRNDLDTRWICPAGLCPWRSSDTPKNRVNNDNVTDRRNILVPRFEGPECEHVNDFVVTLSRSGKIRVWSVRGLQISTSGLRDSVRVNEIANVSIGRDMDISNTVSIAIAPVSQMRFQSRVPKNLSVLLTGNFPSYIQVKFNANRVDHVMRSVPGGFCSHSKCEVSGLDKNILTLVSSNSLEWTVWNTNSLNRETRNPILKEDVHTMSSLVRSRSGDAIYLAIVMKATKLLRLLVMTMQEKRWKDVGSPITMSPLPRYVLPCRDGQHVVGFDQSQLWYRCTVKGTCISTRVNDACSLACGGDLCCVVTGHRNGDIKLWKLGKDNDTLVISQTLSMNGEIQDIQCDSNTGLVCAVSASSRVCIWDTSFCTSRLCGDEKKERGTYARARCEAVLELESTQCTWIHTQCGNTYLAVSNRDGLNLFARSRDKGWSLMCTYDPANEVATMHSVRQRTRVLVEEEEEEEKESVSNNICMTVTNVCSVNNDVIAIFVRIDNSDATEIHHVRIVEDSNRPRLISSSLSNSILEATRAGRCHLTTKILESLNRTFMKRERRKTEDDLLRFNTAKRNMKDGKSVEIELSVAEKLRQIRKKSWTVSSSTSQRKNVFDDVNEDDDAFNLKRLCDVAPSQTSDEDLISQIRAIASISSTKNNEEEASFRFQFACMLRLRAQVSKRIENNQNGLVETEISEGTVQGALESRHIAWAMLSNFQPTLLREHFLDPMPVATSKQDAVSDIETVGSTWERARAVGLPLWIDRPALLWKAATQLARCEFLIGQKQRNPWRAAPFYVAMKKSRVLSTSFQRFGQKRVADFFQRDFTIKANRDAALKNAYKLLSTQRYIEAATFFMLGGQARHMCMTVCVKHLRDPLLGLFLVRLYEGGPTRAECGPIERLLWHEYLFPLARIKNDPWLGSIGRWRLKQYRNAYRVLVGCDVVVPSNDDDDEKNDENHVLDAEDTKRDRKRLIPALKAAIAINAPSISFLCTIFDSSLSAFARCMSKMSQLSAAKSKKKTRTHAFAPDPFDMGQSSLFAQFAVPSSRLESSSTTNHTTSKKETEAEDGLWPPRDAEDALSVRSALNYETRGLSYLSLVELEQSRALDRVKNKRAVVKVIDRILKPLLCEELVHAERLLKSICTRGEESQKDAATTDVVIKRLEECVSELTISFQTIFPLNDVLERAKKCCQDLCLRRTSAVLETISDRNSKDMYSIDLQDIVTRVREYIVAIGNAEEAPMRIASDVISHIGSLVDAGLLSKRKSSAIQNVAHMSSLILAALSRRDVVSIASIFRSYWGLRQEEADSFRWMRDLIVSLEKRWACEDAWSDAEARRRHSAFVESAATEEAIKMASYSMKALRGPSGDSMIRVCRAQALLVLEWCVVRRVGKEIDRAARHLNVSDAMHLKSLSHGFSLLERFHRDRLPSLIPKMYEFAAFSMHACDHALIQSLSETGLLFPRNKLEPHNWLWLNLEGLTAVRDIRAVRAPWLLTGGQMCTWEQVQTTERKEDRTDSNRTASKEENNEEKKHGNGEDVPAQMSTSIPRVYDLFKYSNKDMITSFAFCNSSRREVIVASLKGLTQLTMKDDWSSSARVSLALVRTRASSGNVVATHDSEENDIEQRLGISSSPSSSNKISRSCPSICVRAHPKRCSLFASSSPGKARITLWKAHDSGETFLQDLTWFESSSIEAPPNTSRSSLRFSSDGYRVALGSISDGGNVSIWQLGSGRTVPFYRLTCHKKRVDDVQFLLGGSVFMTAGLSSSRDKTNVAVWDSLMPPKRALVWSASDVHSGGARTLAISSRHQIAISGGDDGDIVVHCLRQRRWLHKLSTGHDQDSIRAVVFSPCENYFATAANDGSLKIWEYPTSLHLTSEMNERLEPTIRYTWPKLHGTRTDMFSATGGGLMTQTGVTALNWTVNGIFSSGADGIMKVIPLNFS